jgi:hypothetical protein
VEFADKEYGYAFDYPADWTMLEVPKGSVFGEVRVFLKGSVCSISALVSRMGLILPEKQPEGGPNNHQLAEVIMNNMVEVLYRNLSKGNGAADMVVAEKKVWPSNKGIEFFISTTHFVPEENTPTDVAGIHHYPFNRDYMIHFILMVEANHDDIEENTTCTNAFQSIRFVVD